ncbi:MAG TPA: ATP-binding protein [Gemmatales bacterium]|nr:ATP-binding protein [Gemmatales bacterium]
MALPSRVESFFSQLNQLNTGAEQIAYVLEHKPSEHEWIDYKQCWMKNATEFDRDKIQEAWSEYLSAFANTEGGLLIVGIRTTSRDTPGEVVPVQSLSELQAILTKQIHVANDPPVQGVRYLPIETAGPDKGVLVCYVPLSPHRPHRREFPGSAKTYVMRAGESCKVIPHSMLKQMFYPFTKVDLDLIQNTVMRVKSDASVEFSMILVLQNKGTATAHEILVVLESNAPVNLVNSHSESGFRLDAVVHAQLAMLQGKAHAYLSRPLHPEAEIEFSVKNKRLETQGLQFQSIDGRSGVRPNLRYGFNLKFHLFAQNAKRKTIVFNYEEEAINDWFCMDRTTIDYVPKKTVVEDE